METCCGPKNTGAAILGTLASFWLLLLFNTHCCSTHSSICSHCVGAHASMECYWAFFPAFSGAWMGQLFLFLCQDLLCTSLSDGFLLLHGKQYGFFLHLHSQQYCLECSHDKFSRPGLWKYQKTCCFIFPILISTSNEAWDELIAHLQSVLYPIEVPLDCPKCK